MPPYIIVLLMCFPFLGLIYQCCKKKSEKSGKISICEGDFEEGIQKNYQEITRDFSRVYDVGIHWFLKKNKAVQEFAPLKNRKAEQSLYGADVSDRVADFSKRVHEYMGRNISEVQLFNIVKWTSITPALKVLDELKREMRMSSHIFCFYTDGNTALHCITAGIIENHKEVLILQSPNLLDNSNNSAMSYKILTHRKSMDIKTYVVCFMKDQEFTDSNREQVLKKIA